MQCPLFQSKLKMFLLLRRIDHFAFTLYPRWNCLNFLHVFEGYQANFP